MISFLFAAALLAQTPQYTYEVVKTYPHDRAAFTEGLEFHNGFLYESTGLNGHSSLRKTKLETGEVLQQIAIPDTYFGEGITIFGDRIVQLTYKTEIGFVYSLDTFRQLRQFNYKGEGWALTHDARNIYMDDGSAEIRVLDPVTLAERRRIKVTDNGKPVMNLNELEYMNGELLANIWQQNRIARISPETGKVTGWIDLTGILGAMYRNGSEDVLNGIAYDAAAKRLFVTGKQWPRVFEIRIKALRPAAASKSTPLH